jgi:hypothetical protein
MQVEVIDKPRRLGKVEIEMYDEQIDEMGETQCR